MATHYSILDWKIPWTEEPGTTVHRVEKSWHNLGNEQQQEEEFMTHDHCSNLYTYRK